jgi:formiminotetrahydrofolate cyclodeaminase
VQTSSESVETSSVATWLTRVSEPTPDPGGGAVAAVVLAHAAALTEMVAGYSTPGDARDGHRAAAASARVQALADAAADAAASAALIAAFRRPDTDAGRAAAVRAAVRDAAASSMAIVDTALALRAALEWAARDGEARLRPDVAVAGRLAAAAIRSAAVNIRCNAHATDLAASETTALHTAEREAVRAADDFDAIAAAVTDAL